jgi:hypothetical protein
VRREVRNRLRLVRTAKRWHRRHDLLRLQDSQRNQRPQDHGAKHHRFESDGRCERFSPQSLRPRFRRPIAIDQALR